MWSKRHQSACGLLSFALCLLILSSSSSNVQKHISSNFANYKHLTGGACSNYALEEPDTERFIAISTSIETRLPVGSPTPGFTVFDRLYVRNKTLYAVTSRSEGFPALVYVLSQAKDRKNGENIDPTSKEMQIISQEEADSVLGSRAVVLSGTSFIFWDTEQFMAHYYHWWGELILGAMRVYSSMSLLLGPLPEPQRFILPNIHDHSWRDRAGVDGPLMRAAWANTPIERGDFWNDMSALNQTFVFERAMVVSRSAAHKSPLASLWYKMISSSMNVTVPESFWEPIRQRVVENTIGYVPIMNNAGVVMSPPKSSAPIVTYISRQSGVRSFSQDAHDGLIAALLELEEEGICQFDVVAMEDLSFSKQVEIVARTTIMVGIHGNGLTHQIWMPPSPLSTVIEVFYPKSYLHDYELLARNMGHKHYAIWNDTALTYPEGKWFNGVEHGDRRQFNGFHTLPVHGPTVADIVRRRLTGHT